MGGRAKGLFRVDGQTLLERLVAVLRPRCAALCLVGDPDGPYAALARADGLVVLPDLIPDRGPPGGVYTALDHARQHGPPLDWVWTVAIDLPRFDAAALATLDAARAEQPRADAVLYRLDGRLQPLASGWHPRAALTFERLLRTGRPGFRAIVARLDVQRVDSGDAQRLGDVDTPADCAALGVTEGGP